MAGGMFWGLLRLRNTAREDGISLDDMHETLWQAQELLKTLGVEQ